MTYGKTILVVVFATALALTGAGTVAGQSAPDCSTVSYDGDGTEESPYEVGNVDQLQCIEEQGLGANYVQVSDIDASGTSSWNGGDGFDPIARDTDDGESGFQGTLFTGAFNGSDHTVSGLTIDRGGTEFVGLFGGVGSAGRLENVALENVDVSGREEVGGLVGLNRGTVERSYVTGDVSGREEVGGLVGLNDAGTIEKSYATGDVSGNDKVGGLVGYNFRAGTIGDSYATGDVSGNDKVGGLVGSNGGITPAIVRDSYATGSVSGDEDVGGLVGRNPDGGGASASESYWDTESTGQSTSAGNGKGLTTSEMTGSEAESNMQEFDFTGTWKTVPNDYPELSPDTRGEDSESEEKENERQESNTENSGDEETTQDSDEGTSNDSDTEEPSENAEDEGMPGFTVVGTVIALLGVAFLLKN